MYTTCEDCSDLGDHIGLRRNKEMRRPETIVYVCNDCLSILLHQGHIEKKGVSEFIFTFRDSQREFGGSIDEYNNRMKR